MSYRIINGQVYSVNNIGITTNSNSQNKISPNQVTANNSFSNILNREIEKKNTGYTISNHAAQRLNGVEFTKEDYNSIQSGLNKARMKGSKNTLMLYKDMAIVASVENNTIITAVDKDRVKENVFTNIDSVVIL